MSYDPLQLGGAIERVVVKGNKRKYTTLARPLRFYRGVSSGYECGCDLRCSMCWSDLPVRKPGRTGRFYSPPEVFDALSASAEKHSHRIISTSASEVTLGRQHLMELLELVDESPYVFLAESNGIRLGHDPGFARELGRYSNLHTRISIKGCDEDEYTKITGAIPESYALQYSALENLMDSGVSVNACLMVSFSTDESIRQAKERLAAIRPGLLKSLELEVISMFPKVAARLRKTGLKPTRIRHRGRMLRLDTES